MLHAYVEFCTLSTSLRLRIANRYQPHCHWYGQSRKSSHCTVASYGKGPTISDKLVGAAWWRRPRMKVYDYNQEFGGNYYQVAKNCLVSLYIRLYVCE